MFRWIGASKLGSLLYRLHLARKGDVDMTTLTIRSVRGYLYVYRPLTEADTWRYIRNGYNPPPSGLEREGDPHVYQYARGETQPRYPMPAIRQGFEFGQSWPDGKCVLIEWRQERYDT